MTISASIKANVNVRITACVNKLFSRCSSLALSSLPLSIESLAHVAQQLQREIASQQTLQTEGNESYKPLENRTTSSGKPMKHKPRNYDGQGSITRWTTQKNSYLDDSNDSDSLTLAVSYLAADAHEWWIVFKEFGDGQLVQTWKDVGIALNSRFQTLNKEKIARDKLARWRKIGDVPTFNNDFQRVLLNIPRN